MTRTVIVDGFRSPLCKEGTDLKNVSPEFLGAAMVSEMIQRMRNWGLSPDSVNLVVGSNVATPAHTPNIARVAAVKGGLKPSVPADTISKNCGSGIAAVNYGDILIRSGRAKTIMVVAVELMSQVPFFYQDSLKNDFTALSRTKSLIAKVELIFKLYPKLFQFWRKEYMPKAGLQLGLTDPICGLIMGLTAENLAKDPSLGISRRDQDQFAIWSHRKAANAQRNGILSNEIIPVYVPGKECIVVSSDNGIRETASFEEFTNSKPFFDRRHGSVTAANSSQITDGAACALLMDEERAKILGLPILGHIVDYCDIGYDPSRMGLSPVAAIANILRKNDRRLSDISVIEINEAFAAQTLACLKVLASDTLMKRFFHSYDLSAAPGEITEEQLNPNGGAIALGHPVGVSGLRLVITALKELERRDHEQALVSACIGGGQGNAMLLERRPR